MKRLAFLMGALVVLALIAAPVSAVLAGEKTHEVKGEIVSVDPTAKTLTFKDETGQNKTVPVMGKAIDTLKTLKAGDKVVLTCSDSEKGEHLGISAVKLDKPPAQ